MTKATIVLFGLLSLGTNSVVEAEGQSEDVNVATEEAPVQFGLETFTQIRINGRDYFLKAPRAGSQLNEVLCEKPSPEAAPAESTKNSAVSKLAPSRRSRAFVNQITEGCTNGRQKLTFEVRVKESANALTRAQTKADSEKPATARNLSPDLDPHVLPDSFGPDDITTGKHY